MFALLKLNFKTYNFNTKVEQGNALIFDIVRKKYVKITPEEWVRQHMVHFLVEDKGVPLGLISVERALEFNGLLKRFDICVSDRSGKMRLLVELKAPHISLNNSTLMQAGIYQKVLGVSMVGISNGIQHLFIQLDENSEKPTVIHELPDFQHWS